MRIFSLGAVALSFLFVCVAKAAAPQLEAYSALPNIEQLLVSPDGQHLAAIVGSGTTRQLQIRDAKTFAIIDLVKAEQFNIRSIKWAGPNHLLMVQAQVSGSLVIVGQKREYETLSDYDLRKKKWSRLMQNQEKAMNAIWGRIDTRTIQGKDFVFIKGLYFRVDTGVFALYSIDLDSGYTKQVEVGDSITTDWVVDDEGQVLARAEYDPRIRSWTLNLFSKDDRPTTAYHLTDLSNSPNIIGLDKTGRAVFISAPENGESRIKAISLSDGSATTLPIAPGHELVFDPKTERAIGTVTENDGRFVYDFFSPTDTVAWANVVQAFPNDLVTLESWSNDRNQIVAHLDGQTYGDGFLLVDITTKNAQWIASEYNGIGPDAVAPTKVIHYAAADGVSIPAFLTLPLARDANRLPLVVLVHGALEARDYPGFDWWTQALASRGYAVLRPQYRGSSSLSAEADYTQWGRQMQTDISDGVRDLAKSGVIDPARVCIAGASYGGYAALAGAVFDPSAYRCAISLAGPADLRRMVDYKESLKNFHVDSLNNFGTTNVVYRANARFLGATTSTDHYLDAISPARHADQSAVPILLIHGDQDAVVPYDQSEAMAAALTRVHKPFEFVTLKGEDHYLSRSDTRLQMLQAMVKFLAAHNPPDGATTVSAANVSAVASSPVSH